MRLVRSCSWWRNYLALLGLVVVAACLRATPDLIPRATIPTAAAPQIAFLADVHLQDVYGSLGDFAGLPSGPGQKNATLRTMYAQLTSTRLFNENYFVFRAALDDIYRRGVRLVALPGDATDDGQPVNVAGLRAILAEYNAKGLRFFITPGNHDPRKPFDDEAAKDDFLGAGGKNQRISSSNSGACRGTGRGHVPDPGHPAGPAIVCTEQIKRLGYAALMSQLADHGYRPSAQDLYWESPFSKSYTLASYTYAAALQESTLQSRQYEICHQGEGGPYKRAGYTSCAFLPDASYLVEPIRGVWLLAIDANVYQPKAVGAFDAAHPDNPANYDESSDAGYNAVLTHKKHLVEWLTRVVQRARAEGKQLIAFSHFPMSEFYNGQSDRMAALFLPGAFQLARRPRQATTRTLAATGLQLHIGGHMHLNNTGVYSARGGTTPAGDFLVNIQTPALGVFGAAYKLLTLRTPATVDVQTIALDDVPRFAELFAHYEVEWQRLRTSTDPADAGHLWNHALLTTRSYHDFTRLYFAELARLRLLPSYWPCRLQAAVQKLDGAQLLTLSQLQTPVTLAQLKEAADIIPIPASCAGAGTPGGPRVDPRQLRADWAAATVRATALAQAAGFQLADFARLTPVEFYGDFHRAAYAGELALRDLGSERLKQYTVLTAAFARARPPIFKIADRPAEQNPLSVVLQCELDHALRIFQALLTGPPSVDFRIDLTHQTVRRTTSLAPLFH